MPFTAGLRESLQIRGSLLPSEFIRGDSLEHVLDRHLLAVERDFGDELIASVLLLSADGKRLSHGSAPNLPRSFRDAIDGAEIGPCAGSCGTAAFLGRPVYALDIAIDPLWADYRHLALPLGLRSCWSTPIRDPQGSVIGTFAIYHRTVGGPTRDEIEAIDVVTGHVADAIMWAGTVEARRTGHAPRLRLVHDADRVRGAGGFDRLLQHAQKLETLAAELERHADTEDSQSATILNSVAQDSRRLVSAIRLQIDRERST
jgi:GAF domain-containing protein